MMGSFLFQNKVLFTGSRSDNLRPVVLAEDVAVALAVAQGTENAAARRFAELIEVGAVRQDLTIVDGHNARAEELVENLETIHVVVGGLVQGCPAVAPYVALGAVLNAVSLVVSNAPLMVGDALEKVDEIVQSVAFMGHGNSF